MRAALLAVLAGCAHSSLPTPTPEQVAAAQSWAPGITLEALDAARALAQEKCAACHAPPKPAKKLPDQWPAVMVKMGAKAKLSPEQVAAVTAYLQAMSEPVP